MGSSGMKRNKNRSHLPKVDTATEERYELEHARDAVVENFGIRPSSRTARLWAVVGVVIVLLAVLAIVGWVVMT